MPEPVLFPAVSLPSPGHPRLPAVTKRTIWPRISTPRINLFHLTHEYTISPSRRREIIRKECLYLPAPHRPTTCGDLMARNSVTVGGYSTSTTMRCKVRFMHFH